MGAEVRDDRVLAPTRWTARLIIPVLVAAFVILFGFPDRTKELWAWTIHPDMTARVMGGGYLAGAWLFFRVATSHHGHEASVALAGTTVFTTLLLLATILHWDKFNHTHVSFWAWIGLYIVTPVLLPWLWVRTRRVYPGPAPGDLRVPETIRFLFGVIGVVQLSVALVIFVWPDVAIDNWPWALTPLTARTLSAFIAFPAVTWALLLAERRWSALRIPVEAAAAGLSLVLAGSILSRDDFQKSGGGWPLYAAVLGAAVGWLVGVLVVMARRARRTL